MNHSPAISPLCCWRALLCWVAISLWGLSLLPGQVQAEPPEIRQYEAEQLATSAEDEAFQYGLQPLPPSQKRKQSEAETPKTIPMGQVLKFLLYALVGLVLIGLAAYIISRTMGKNARLVSTAGIPDLEETDIREVNFPDLLQHAISQRAYRNAVRLLFLDGLKQLTEANLIHWKANKTNHDYQAELRGHPLSEDFRQLTRAYEYVWYGNLLLSQEQFAQIHQRFTHFLQQLPPGS